MAVTKEELDRYLEAFNNATPLIDDATYDQLLEEYLAEHGEENRPYLRMKQSDTTNQALGTITKVYGVTKPMRPGQKVYADWIRKQHLQPHTHIIAQCKVDGCSIAYNVKELYHSMNSRFSCIHIYL